MDVFTALVNNVKKLTDGKVFILTFNDSKLKTLVIKLNLDQLRASQLSDDTLIPFTYALASEEFGKTPGRRWTLHDTGELYDSFKVLTVTEEAIIEIGDLEKEGRDFDELFKGNVLGLNTESQDILIKEALPLMRDIVLSELLKGIS